MDKEPVLVIPKGFWESKTNLYNTVKAILGFLTVIATFLLLMQNNGTLPFEVPGKWLFFIEAFLLMLDGYLGVKLRSITASPIVPGSFLNQDE